MQKVLLVTNIPTPYRIPLFNILHDELRKKGIDFKVIFAALGYARRQWRVDMRDCLFPYEVLPSTRLFGSDSKRGNFTYRGLGTVLRREQPRVIVSNGFSIGTTKLWKRSLVRPTSYVIWSGAILGESSEHWLRRLHRKALIQRASAFVAYGSLARRYLLDLGAPPEDVTVGINTVDTGYFSRETERFNHAAGQNGKKRLLFIGELIPRKGADRLLPDIQKLARQRQDFVLDIVGSGSEQPKLEQMVQSLGIKEYVNFVGFKQRHEMPYYMGRANCFVFPTRHDIWGLVLVEAMSAGLPCVSSLNAGATWDLIQDGKTGCAVDFSDSELVTQKLHWLLDHPEESKVIGQRARLFIEQEVTLKKSADGFVAAVEKALNKHCPNA
jgi:glycosyltransferase involved in cell wall biosynthesis